jgi:hypothetical protein
LREFFDEIGLDREAERRLMELAGPLQRLESPECIAKLDRSIIEAFISTIPEIPAAAFRVKVWSLKVWEKKVASR